MWLVSHTSNPKKWAAISHTIISINYLACQISLEFETLQIEEVKVMYLDRLSKLILPSVWR